MAVQKILIYPEHKQLLRAKSQRVNHISQKEIQLVNDLVDTYWSEPMLGLAAVQIGELVRAFVFDSSREESGERGHPEIMINPVILNSTGMVTDLDGCMSIPGLGGYTNRAEAILVRYQDITGSHQEDTFRGLTARVIQHEVDHLDGILYIDHIDNEDDVYGIFEDKAGQQFVIPWELHKTGCPPELKNEIDDHLQRRLGATLIH